MKPVPGTLALLSFALCIPSQAQDTTIPSQPAPQNTTTAQTAAAHTTHTVGISDIRIVRLSQVRGNVEVDRIGRGYEEAFANIPITGGTKLRTDVGLAEVEFEDNSSIRLTPDTEVDFVLLKRTATGATISSMNVVKGTVYASMMGKKGNTFTISGGNANLELDPSSHIRLTIDGADSHLSVLEGNVQFALASSTMTLNRKQAIVFDATGAKPAEMAKNEKNAFDQWDKSQVEYQKHYSSVAATGGNGLAFGSSDMNYYGGFESLPGCGNVWRPYFASAAWDPYSNGAYAYYPGVGYSWVSPYPWGWLPFHSGSWVSCGNAGWGWQPGGQFVGLQNVAGGGTGTVVGGRTIGRPLAPPVATGGGTPSIIPVNRRPLATSSVTAPGTFTFRNDSAGMGVPRDTFGKLRGMSMDVQHHGMANTEVETGYIAPTGPRGGAAGPRGAAGPDAVRAGGHSGRMAGGQPGADGMAQPRGVMTMSRPSMESRGMQSDPGGWRGGSGSPMNPNANGAPAGGGRMSSPSPGPSGGAPGGRMQSAGGGSGGEAPGSAPSGGAGPRGAAASGGGGHK